MSNADLARAFERIADLLEILGEDRFRTNSYRRVARSVEDLDVDIAQLAREGRLGDIAGVGKGVAPKIEQFLATGRIDILDELESRLPKGLPDLLAIPGVGPKKIAAMHKELGVTGVDDLKRAIDNGALAELSGFGPASVKKIAEGIAFLESSGGRTPLGQALPVAETMADDIAKWPGVHRVAVAGSLRRAAETIGDIDILCAADDGESTVRKFTSLAVVKRVLADGATKGSITIDAGEGREVQIDLRVVDSKSFGAALQYFTGSKAHNVRLRELAIRKGLRLNEYGLHDGQTCVASENEEDVYAALGVPCPPPELREDRGELSVENPPSLIAVSDIRGDLHMHTVASDGRNTIEEMAAAARELGYEYIAICDHSKSSTIANGLSIERMTAHIEAIRAAARKTKGIAILAGCECDILPDGSLDYPNDILAECDWVVASIHSAMTSSKGPGKASPTERTLAAIENQYVSAIGHPTGRLINRRPAMELDMPAIIEAAARTGTCLEVNASWQRLDLKDAHVRQAIAGGVTLVIDTDAHSTQGLAEIRYGVLTARRGGAARENVLNTRSLDGLRDFVARKRGN